MKSLKGAVYVLFVLCLLCLSTTRAFCETWILLDAVTVVGPGPLKVLTFADFRTWTCDVTTTGNPTAVTVRMDGNQTGDMLFDPVGMADVTLTPAQLAARRGTFSMTDMPVRYIRANLVTLTGGTSPTVTVVCTGVR
ncbi:secreted protein [Candidatus Magnetobacterium bavaricum]|uniref:Secreted protein n=1 Tax=Candidatus Magnetobacterium bavaricum TaxID=29290 RepID=A0A0F3GMX4_9BACT|nr:secreted protein [Candidatus Magnetobacterium bavaricum]